jgi:drug/metabolite transporter (DMT)-like permease
MVLGALLFASLGVVVKMASQWFTSAELVFYRGLVSIVLLWLLARHRGVSLATRHPGMHAWRSAVGVVSLGAWFYAIAHLPLATAMTLNYMSSVWIAAFLVGSAVLAWLPVRPRPRPGPDAGAAARPPLHGALVLAVLSGFGGVVMILRPDVGATVGDHGYAGPIGLLSGMLAALAYMQVIALSAQGEPDVRTVFYFSVGSALGGGLAMGLTGATTPWSQWSWTHAVWLLPLGVLASVGQLCMTRAYAAAKSASGTLLVANLQYSGIVFAAIYSVALFGERIDALDAAGMALIVGSGVAATILRQRSTPRALADDH